MVSPPQEVMVPAGAGRWCWFTVFDAPVPATVSTNAAAAGNATGSPLFTLRKQPTRCKKIAKILPFLADDTYSPLP
jgi:hypothetical protein